MDKPAITRKPSLNGPRFTVSNADTIKGVVESFALEFGDMSNALILYFASNRYDFNALAEEMCLHFSNTTCIGCTTAGELSTQGYTNSSVVAIAFPSQHFRVQMRLIENLKARSVSDCMRAARKFSDQLGDNDGWSRQGILLVDGVSRQEDALIAAIDSTLHGISVIGGSAGDGLAFRKTAIAVNRQVQSDCAVLCMLETDFQIHELIFDHIAPTETRMVVTGADPASRLITEINAEPAAEEYAYQIGKKAKDLTPFDFASNPLLVRAGERFHVRAIQEITPDGALRLMSAIDEGVILTLGKAQDIVAGLADELSRLPWHPDLILSFDCILRRLDAERLDKADAVSDLFRRHNMVGFNTYGEQHHGMHVNQTFVGVAFSPPAETA